MTKTTFTITAAYAEPGEADSMPALFWQALRLRFPGMRSMRQISYEDRPVGRERPDLAIIIGHYEVETP